MFGADNCRASVPQPGTQLGLQVGWRREVPIKLHIWLLQLSKSFITPFSKWTQTHSIAKKTVESIFLVSLFEVPFF